MVICQNNLLETAEPESVERSCKTVMQGRFPIRVTGKPNRTDLDYVHHVRHWYVQCDRAQWKRDTFIEMCEVYDDPHAHRRIIVYCNSVAAVDNLYNELKDPENWDGAVFGSEMVHKFHGSMAHEERTAELQAFLACQRQLSFMITTDEHEHDRTPSHMRLYTRLKGIVARVSCSVP